MILSNISTPLLGIVDTAVLGHLDSEQFLAAVAIAGLVFSFLFWGFGFLRMGTTGLTAQALGEHKQFEMNAVLFRALILVVIISSIILLLRQYIADLSLVLLQSSVQVEQLALEYFNIRIWSAPATLALYALMGWFLGRQNVRVPLLVVVLSNVSNIILDIVFVYHLNLQITGVALATVIAEYLGLMLALIIASRNISMTNSWNWKSLFDIRKFKTMLVINSHIFIRTWCLIFAFGFFTAQGARMGDTILAANAVLLNFQTFMAYALDGFAHAAEAVVGKALGGKNKVMVKQAFWTAALWSGFVALGFSMIYFFFGISIIDLLTNLEQVRVLANQYLYWLIVMPVASFICYLLDGVFIGAMMTREMRNTMLFSLLMVFMPVWYFTQYLGNQGLWLAMISFMLARSLSMTIVFIKSGKVA